MAASSCGHKPAIGCALVVLPVCCSCADRRPQSTEGYPDYVDGVGMTLSGKRWTKYCSKCRNYWENESSAAVAVEDGEEASWSFPPRNRASNLPVRSRRAPPGISVRGIPAPQQTVQDPHPPPFPPNPFGTREELLSEDYVSPLDSMFTRAYTRYRDAETNRRRLRMTQDRLLADISAPIASRYTRYSDEVRRIHDLAREMASEIVQSSGPQYSSIRQRTSPSPPRVNPIDEQARPPALSSDEMVVSIACRICNEQRIDTLMEPCMHACLCHWCSEIIRDQAQSSRRRRRAGFGNLEDHSARQDWKCPICRHAVSGVRRIYLC